MNQQSHHCLRLLRKSDRRIPVRQSTADKSASLASQRSRCCVPAPSGPLTELGHRRGANDLLASDCRVGKPTPQLDPAVGMLVRLLQRQVVVASGAILPGQEDRHDPIAPGVLPASPS